MKTPYLVLRFCLLTTSALADPQLTSWFTLDSGKAAQIYRTEAEKASGQTETTWSNGRNTQAQPAGCGVQEILSSSNWVYIRSTGLGSQVMGPWQNGYFPNLPTDQHFIYAFTRHPVVQTTHNFNQLGEIGLFVDGVRMFDANDAFSYSTQNGRDADPRAGIGQGDRIWNRDAYVNEARTFDASLGHQQNRGTYHYHAEPMALRYLLGDHVDFDAATKTYHESSGAPAKHSPILGWMQDGYPIYGPYGYSNPTNPASGLRRMVSGFVIRNGENGSDNLAPTGRRTLPAWEARENNRATILPGTETGPAVSSLYPLGHYLEDYAYLGDLGRAQGRDFDLDELNGRWCVTPEFPQGTYAYFTTIDAAGRPAYPLQHGPALSRLPERTPGECDPRAGDHEFHGARDRAGKNHRRENDHPDLEREQRRRLSL
ncbi:MAG: YHYH protein [Verrucomicrobiae bacterium]|nr:YHYH protein [Verrucomicrobiae bacterium]